MTPPATLRLPLRVTKTPPRKGTIVGHCHIVSSPDAEGFYSRVALINGGDEAAAAFLATAANEYEKNREIIAALVKALEDARTFVELCYDETDGEEAVDGKYVLKQVDAALAMAKGATAPISKGGEP